MYKSLATFMKGCTKVKPHKWICDVKLVRHVGRKKEKKEAKGKGHSAKGELKKRNWLKQSQDKLACIYCDLIWRVWKGEGKDEEIKGEAFGHLKEGVKMWSRKEKREVPASETEDWCSLEELREWEQAKEEKNREIE